MKPMLLNKERIISQESFARELKEELYSILHYWSTIAVDERRGGFYGSVNKLDQPDTDAQKGVVMMARICWAFSEAYRLDPLPEWREQATRAYEYLVSRFWDVEYGGMYWSVTAEGDPAATRKQIYGQAFCIYALSTYYRISNDGLALHLAKDLYDYIENISYEEKNGGYIEAFARDGSPVTDLRLSEKDANESKTANTHLHIVEAYAQLYKVAPKEELRDRIEYLLGLFDAYFITPDGTLRLFFDDNWISRSGLRSFGHEIESAWLLHDCAKTIGHDNLEHCFKQHAENLANAAMKGMDTDGGLWYELETATSEWIREKHSWPQAEAMIGFVYLWQLLQNDHWLDKAKASWNFVKNHLRDEKSGEWFWGVDAGYHIIDKEKAGFWKCPYHNTRAIIEILKRVSV